MKLLPRSLVCVWNDLCWVTCEVRQFLLGKICMQVFIPWSKVMWAICWMLSASHINKSIFFYRFNFLSCRHSSQSHSRLYGGIRNETRKKTFKTTEMTMKSKAANSVSVWSNLCRDTLQKKKFWIDTWQSSEMQKVSRKINYMRTRAPERERLNKIK